MESQSGPQKQKMEASGAWRVSRAMYFRLDSRRLMGNLLICQAENEATSQPIQSAYRLDILGKTRMTDESFGHAGCDIRLLINLSLLFLLNSSANKY